jgi:Ca-activated chloride channel family protein
LAEKLLAPTGVPGTVLLIGDGVNEEAIEMFSDYFDHGANQLVIWAIGDASKVDQLESGSSLIPLQLSQLENLASDSKGRLVLMTHDKQDVDRVDRYLENNLVILEDEATPWYDSGYPLVFVIAGFFLLWFRKGWTLQW